MHQGLGIDALGPRVEPVRGLKVAFDARGDQHGTVLFDRQGPESALLERVSNRAISAHPPSPLGSRQYTNSLPSCQAVKTRGSLAAS
ncbi:MAG: hypothetical protein OEW22_06305, partial [Rubrivivax sp.]|nr:hypothetical protein [Rubrivivax sp.]